MKIKTETLTDAIRRAGFIKVEELAKQFAVSPSSIRRKLTELEKDGFVVRTHGGVKSITTTNRAWRFSRKKHTNALEKRLIAIKALKLVHDGDMFFWIRRQRRIFLRNIFLSFLT